MATQASLPSKTSTAKVAVGRSESVAPPGYCVFVHWSLSNGEYRMPMYVPFPGTFVKVVDYLVRFHINWAYYVLCDDEKTEPVNWYDSIHAYSKRTRKTVDDRGVFHLRLISAWTGPLANILFDLSMAYGSKAVGALCRVDSKKGNRQLSDVVVSNNESRFYVKRDCLDETKVAVDYSVHSPGKPQQQSKPVHSSPNRSIAADPVTLPEVSSPASTTSSADGRQADYGDPTDSASSPCRSAKRGDRLLKGAQVAQADGTSGGDTFLDADWEWGEEDALLRDCSRS